MTGVVDSVGAVGVIGAGTMGAGIAQLALEAGHDVRVHDVDAAAIERGRARIRTGLERRAARLDLDPDSADAWVDGRLDRLTDAPTLADVAAADPGLVIEAAIEDLDLKRAIFRELGRSASGPDDPRHEHERPVRRPTSPPRRRPVRASSACTSSIRRLSCRSSRSSPRRPRIRPSWIGPLALMTAWGKVPVRSADTPGFIVNRVNRPFTLEALAMLEAGGTSVEAIDAAIRADGFPLGPFELMDLTGIDISLAAALGIFERSRAAGDPLAERFRPSPIQERLVAEGRLGRKTGGGLLRLRRRRPAPWTLARVRRDPRARRATTMPARASSNGSSSPSSTRRTGRPAMASPHRPTSTSRCASARRIRAARSSGPRRSAARPRVLAALAQLASDGPRFDPAPSLAAAGKAS